MHRPLALACIALSIAACSGKTEAERFPLGGSPASEAVVPADAVSGTLVEQISAPPYVYVRLKTANGDEWAAVNEAPLTIGAKVTVYNTMVMEKFESKTLNRTFDRIYFGALEAPGGPPSAMPGGGAAPTSVGTPPAMDAHVGTVEKATGANARTIAELWAQMGALSGKTVSIRGVVVKYNPGVMGRNWIHLQDGSGNAATGTHDITVTSADDVVIGTTVTITGTVSVNKDFGAGYVYALIVEDAKVVAK